MRRVLWHEGLLLTPQHFQSLDSRQEWLFSIGARLYEPYSWGVHKIKMSEGAIGDTSFGIESVSAVFPDGTLLTSPADDLLPRQRSFKEFLSPGRGQLLVYLALPKEDPSRPGVIVSRGDSDQSCRYERVVEEKIDYVSGMRSREIGYAAKAPVLRFQGESLDGYDNLEIALIRVGPSGRPELDDRFLPPSLSLSASLVWAELMSSIYQRAASIAETLRKRIPFQKDRAVTLAAADLSNYLPLQELVRSLPALKHLWLNPDMHPFNLYQSLSVLTAGLMTVFGSFGDRVIEDLPDYDHRSPGLWAFPLRDRLYSLFDRLTPAPIAELRMEVAAEQDDLWSVDLSTRSIDSDSHIYVWIKAELANRELIERVRLRIRVASSDRVFDLIKYALQGLPLEPTAQPLSLPGAGLGQYFRVEKQGQLWESVLNSKRLSFHVMNRTADFPGFEIRAYLC
jgi:type VI secretion system protein ImpJ